ncbi:hypothetical protein K469DRAFT_731508 [Zopfia rhizophila CBS 207.26]|uniref:Uncharacterized protein n=1 Tax=Zopfia rhizophila CBS 207.26 TaxID=1314779 RepID=A0A6A6DM99_9PEZI|nr:hypothetical protein K469DRAFT_731508 [Zopfia rhizophila CBS 207.26]
MYLCSLYNCGDWKWGCFRQCCTKKHRIGHTCGIKLIMDTVSIGTKCKLCRRIDTKLRRRKIEVERIDRWRRESDKFYALINKAVEVIWSLNNETAQLSRECSRRQ